MAEIAESLKQGNLVNAAQQAVSQDWRKHAAMALIGCGRPALEGLAQIDTPEARLFHAIGLWIEGNEDAAAAMLDYAPDGAAADHLRMLIAKDRIETLAFLPPHVDGPHSIFGSLVDDRKFRVRPIWFHAPSDMGMANEVDADISYFYNARNIPDLLICEMAEWHLLPRNLSRGPFFKVAHTSDFDIHGQEVLPWLKMFDSVLTLDQTEWGRLRRAIPGHAVLNYPKVFTVRDRELTLPDNRPIDVLMTGTVYSDYHHDKNELIARLASIPGLNCVLLNGFVGHDEYERLIKQSKLTLSFVRHSGTMPTRALESVALGTWSLVQHDTALRLYVPEQSSLLLYTHGKWKEFERDIRKFVECFPNHVAEYNATALATRKAICEEFAPPRVASQYLRFCAALPAINAAIGLKPSPAYGDPGPMMQKRGCVTKGWLPADGEAQVMRSILENNIQIGREIESYRGFNECGREYLIEYARLASADKHEPILLETAVIEFEAALKAEPKALAPRFNLIRAGFHFGDTKLRARTVKLTSETLELADELVLDAWDDLLPYDFYPSHFNGQLVCDVRLDAMGGDEVALHKVAQLILASLQYYLARSLGNRPEAEAHYRAAINLDPQHAHFQTGFAEYILAARPDLQKVAGELLGYMVGRRTWNPMLDGLEKYAVEGSRKRVKPRANVLFLDIEEELARHHRYRLARCHTMTGELFYGSRRICDRVPRTTLLISGAGIIASQRLEAALTKLRDEVADVEVVLVETALDVRGNKIAEMADAAITVPQPGGLAYSSIAIRWGLQHVTAPYVFVVQPDSDHLEAAVDQVIRFTREGYRHIDPLALDRRALVISRNNFSKWPSKEIVCVGLKTSTLIEMNLPLSVGMLQCARLTLPILVHQLRGGLEGFLLANLETGQVTHAPHDTQVVDIDQFLCEYEDKALRAISPEWRRFMYEVEANRPCVRLMLETLEDNEIACDVIELLHKEAAAGLPVTVPQPGIHAVAEFSRDSLTRRLARALYRRLLTNSDGTPGKMIRSTPQGGLAMGFGIGFVEYHHPHLRVRFHLPRLFLRRR